MAITFSKTEQTLLRNNNFNQIKLNIWKNYFGVTIIKKRKNFYLVDLFNDSAFKKFKSVDSILKYYQLLNCK